MANASLFRSIVGKLLPATDARNSERAPAYAFGPKHELAQAAATGCFHRTFYASAESQLERVIQLAYEVEPALVAKTAVYARERGRMKDVPAVLCATLSFTDGALLERAFPRVIDSGRMLRTFVQVVRSGVVGRKSFGSRPKRLLREWLRTRTDEALLAASVGQKPSLDDVVRMVHPRPESESRRALYAWLLGRPYEAGALPGCVRAVEAFRAGESLEVPDVPFGMLSSLPLSQADWTVLAGKLSWQTLRMNLNTLSRNGVFESKAAIAAVARRLADREEIARSGVFPYQLLAAWLNVGAGVPRPVVKALEEAMEAAIDNVPEIEGRVVVCPDVSGSMQSPVTGYREGGTTKMRCVDVAALVAAAVLRKNRGAVVLPFEQEVVNLRLNPKESVMRNAEKLAKVGGGGTSCSAPLAELNRRGAPADLVIFVSDNESWVDAGAGRGTAQLSEWQRLRERCPEARMVCIDIQPNRTTQAKERADILNVGGFSDAVFDLVADFAAGRLDPGHWVSVIEAIEI